jgi:hypothetical protein
LRTEIAVEFVVRRWSGLENGFTHEAVFGKVAVR